MNPIGKNLQLLYLISSLASIQFGSFALTVFAQEKYSLQLCIATPRAFKNDGNVISSTETKDVERIGLGSLLFKHMSKNKDFTAQIDTVTEQPDTYGSMLQRSIRTAIAMRAKGITSNDIVTVCSSNHLNTYIPLIASYFLGAKTANTDPNLSLRDTVHLLKQVRPSMIFVSPDAVPLIENVVQELGLQVQIVVFGESSKHSQFSEFLVESPQESDFAPVQVADVKETAVIFFSSGTSGLPKGICLSHMTVISQLIKMPTSEDSPPIVMLTYSSPYWITSLSWLLTNTVNKIIRLLPPAFDPVNIWKIIEKYQANLLFLTPNQISTMLNYGPGDANVSSVRMVITTGGPFSVEQIEATKKAFPFSMVSSGFGQTETAGAVIIFNIAYEEDIKLLMTRPHSCGRPVAGFSYKIADLETDQPLGANQRGELRLKSEYQMNGYYNMDSSGAWDAEGFIKTGDIAYYDEDYCFFVVDRIKEMLKFQGWQIAPAMLEAVLLTHPEVDSAVVIGIPDLSDGDHPMAVVELKKSIASSVTAKDIEKYVEERVSEKKRLRGGVKIVDKMPLTASGKLQKRHVKELVLGKKL